MFTHAMIGSNELERARGFHDAKFAASGGKPGEMDARGRLIYAHDGGQLMITKPIDRNPATAANGGTIGVATASCAHVLAWHEAGATHGGTAIENSPGERPNGSFAVCLRDPDGSKRAARCPAAK